MDRPEIKILLRHGIPPSTEEGRSMLNTRRALACQKGKDDRSIGRFARQEISDTVFVDTRNASLVTTIGARQEHEFSSDFSRRKRVELYTWTP